MIDQLNSKSEDVMLKAVEALIEAGARVVPDLVDALSKRRECQFQFVASGVLRAIEPAHNRVEQALAQLARGECSGNSEQDFILKQQAAFALSYIPTGIPVLADMVSHKDLLTRRRVAFAFDDLTEAIESTLEERTPLATLVEPTARALPKLAPLLADVDEQVRCMTLETLEQARDSRHKSLATAAKEVLAGKKVSCSR